MNVVENFKNSVDKLVAERQAFDDQKQAEAKKAKEAKASK